MNQKQQLDLIRQKCIEANPEIEGKLHAQWGCPKHDPSAFKKQLHCTCVKVNARPIRLADVLLAMHTISVYVGDDGQFYQFDGFTDDGGHALQSKTIAWNLRKDRLNEQSDECIRFLADLLAQSTN
jgi:hypothetical protein